MSQINLSPQIKPGKLPKQPPVGLGGWFVFILMGLFGTTILSIVYFIQSFEIWQHVDLGFGCLYAFDYLNSIILSIVILIFIFRKNILFRNLFLVQTCIFAICFFIYMYLCRIYLMEFDSSIGSLVGRILWTVYLFKSERVKNTFIGMKTFDEMKTQIESQE